MLKEKLEMEMLRFREGWYLDELEIIGNIYENPEFLKEVNK